ncbi:hypothetical protein OHB26_06325 [Nocardia sp. NBC_01503]|uniref:hypothetical protein n=1 Tax=Nocardia sp. NBC_01503 TaxID=2975997 RepID=UPI002E7C3C9D|nr:hypothetical protein [Nocardia sp. NBC_01503]WTL33829.1 hypothetical protein OHB26_06325 [Nocardia sp. NBC_01503]
MPVLEVNSLLVDTAFGATPGRAATGLPAARTATESWLRAVSLSGIGHYAAARVELRHARVSATDPVLRSLTHSLEGSLLRQLGWHARAAVADGRAAALVLPATPASGRAAGIPEVTRITTDSNIARAEAVCDALTGLAADALGTARPELAARLLNRCRNHLEQHLADPETVWRQRIRLHWVSAETALCAPGAGLIFAPEPNGPVPGAAVTSSTATDPALAHAETALALAENSPSKRHLVKSRLLVAAASAAHGDLDRSRALAAEVAAETAEFELLPLRWACAMLRSGIDPESGGAAEAFECERLLACRGGRLRSASDTLGQP